MKNLKSVFVLFGLLMFGQPAFAAEALSTLSWEPPTTRLDGTALEPSEIGEYRIYYAIDSEPDLSSEVVSLTADTVNRKITLELDPRPEPYVVSFSIMTVDIDGARSPLSEPVSKSFDVDSTAAPGAPTNLQFNLVCVDGAGCEITELTPGIN